MGMLQNTLVYLILSLIGYLMVCYWSLKLSHLDVLDFIVCLVLDMNGSLLQKCLVLISRSSGLQQHILTRHQARASGRQYLSMWHYPTTDKSPQIPTPPEGLATRSDCRKVGACFVPPELQQHPPVLPPGIPVQANILQGHHHWSLLDLIPDHEATGGTSR